MDNLLKKRFQELAEQIEVVEATKTVEHNQHSRTASIFVDDNVLLNWTVKAKNILSKTCGIGSQHFMHFTIAEKGGMYTTSWETLQAMKAVYFAAKEDFDGGYLSSIQSLVQAEVFGSELEQAEELLKNGYRTGAAVIAGVVLETCIRDLCTRHQISPSKLDKMNADLAKAGVYNGIVQKRVTHLAAVRNSAAHGNQDEFNTYDVAAMIAEVEQFLSIHLN